MHRLIQNERRLESNSTIAAFAELAVFGKPGRSIYLSPGHTFSLPPPQNPCPLFLFSGTRMADEKVKPVKKEEEEVDDDDDNIPIAASRAKPVKKEEPKEEKDDDDHLPLVLSKNKKRKPDAPSKPKKGKLDGEEDQKIKKKGVGKSNAARSKAKKEDLEEQDEKADKKKKKKKKVEEQKVVGKKGRGATSSWKEKKVYDLPGQKHDPPEERDPLRIFYETLYQQVPNSEMAAFCFGSDGMISNAFPACSIGSCGLYTSSWHVAVPVPGEHATST
ncbi:uncharacterized protein [Elaeis guineensis]|uniref:uncharacterized protein isoform X2 n=1 Tax=Elaeis guineensis var. tenera TaxID=51953 RepID=UPI003C6D2A90